jgi:hypothetical protein
MARTWIVLCLRQNESYAANRTGGALERGISPRRNANGGVAEPDTLGWFVKSTRFVKSIRRTNMNMKACLLRRAVQHLRQGQFLIMAGCREAVRTVDNVSSVLRLGVGCS